MTDPVRVVAFLDWQNIYNHAREAFHSKGDHHVKGQVNPIDLGEVLASRVEGGVLTAVRIYRGMPDQAKDEKGYAAVRRQSTAWQKDPRVILTTRRLRYPDAYQAGRSSVDAVKEKGIDVALALDLVTMATDVAYDVAVLMSCDHDLSPAVERVLTRRNTRNGGPCVEVAAWNAPIGKSPRLRISAGRLPCHWLDQQAYWGVIDEHDYSRPSPTELRPRRNG